MTKLRALIKARDMWEWLRDNPDAFKTSYFTDNDIYPIPNNSCYLCEYCKEEEYDEDEGEYQDFIHCENCPVQWTGYPQDEYEEIYCCDPGSPYRDWWDAAEIENYQQKAGFAQQVVNLINEGIEKAIAEEGDEE